MSMGRYTGIFVDSQTANQLLLTAHFRIYTHIVTYSPTSKDICDVVYCIMINNSKETRDYGNYTYAKYRSVIFMHEFMMHIHTYM